MRNRELPPPEKDETPFQRKLKDLEEGQMLHELEDDPRFVIREFSIKRLFFGKRTPDSQELEDLLGAWRHFDELQKAGIHLPESRLVRGKNKLGDETIFVVADRIEGNSLEQTSKLSPDSAKKFDDFASAMARYYLNNIKKKQPHWAELSLAEQVVYGRSIVNSDEEPQVYMVDLDPGHIDPETGRFYKTDKEEAILSLRDFIRQVENKLGGVKLEAARIEYQKLVEGAGIRERQLHHYDIEEDIE